MADRIFNVRMLASVLHRVHTDALDLTVSLSRVIGRREGRRTKFHLTESVAEYKCMHRQNLTPPGSLSGAAGKPSST